MLKNLKTLLVSAILATFILPSFASAQTVISDGGTIDNSSCISVNSNLSYAKRRTNNQEDVYALQDFLNTQGYLNDSSITGFFGKDTLQAVKNFQTQAISIFGTNKIDTTLVPDASIRQALVDASFVLSNTGNVGAYTRAKIAYVSCSGLSDIGTTPTTVNQSPTVEFIGTPTIGIQYNTTNGSMLTGHAKVKITTGSTPVYSNDLWNLLQFVITTQNERGYTGPVYSNNLNGYVTSPDGSFNFGTVNATVIPVNTSGTLEVAISIPTKEIFSGLYVVRPTISTVTGVPPVSSNPISVIGESSIKNVINSQTSSISQQVSGETAPYISSVTCDSTPNVNCGISGVRFNPTSNTVTVGGITKEITATSYSWTTATGITFQMTDFGITKAGTYVAQVKNENGVSNYFTLTSVGINNSQNVSAPTVEFIGVPTLDLKSDPTGKESMLVGKATVKITTGNQAINLGDNPYSFVAQLLQFNNGSFSISTNSLTWNVVSSFGSARDIPANTSVTFDVTNTVKTSELFAGTYFLKPNDLTYSSVNDKNTYLAIKSSSFKNAQSSNSKSVFGETSPYITTVFKDEKHPDSGNYLIYGLRFNQGVSSSNNVTINNITKSLPANSLSYNVGPNSSSSISFKPSDFGITQNGTYFVQVSTSEGASNAFTFNFTGGTANQINSIPVLSYITAKSYSPAGVPVYKQGDGSIIINGTGFNSSSCVYYYQNNVPFGSTCVGTNLTVSSDGTKITVFPLSLANGTYQIKIGNNGIDPSTNSNYLNFIISSSSTQINSQVTFERTAGMVGVTVSPNSQQVKIGSFTVNAGSENIKVGEIGVVLNTNGYSVTNITNLTLKNGSTVLSTPIGTAVFNNTFYLNPVTIYSNGTKDFGTKTFDVYADIGGATSGSVRTDMRINYVTATGIPDSKNATGVNITSASSASNIIVKVVSPNGGEVWKTGETHTITWNALNLPSSALIGFQLLYQTTGGSTYEDGILDDMHGMGISNTGSYQWTIPAKYGIGMNPNAFKLRVVVIDSSYSTNAPDDYSDSPFTISSNVTTLPDLAIKNFVLSSLNSNGSFNQNEDIKVTSDIVNVGNAVATPVEYMYSQPSDAYSTINTSENTCYAGIILQPNQSCRSSYKFKFSSTGYHTLGITADKNNKLQESNENNNNDSISFIVVPPIVTSSQSAITIAPVTNITSPNGGESLNFNQSTNITWNSNDTRSARISVVEQGTVSPYGGPAECVIALSVPLTSKSYSWTPTQASCPNIAGGYKAGSTYKASLKYVVNGAVTTLADESDNGFTFTAPVSQPVVTSSQSAITASPIIQTTTVSPAIQTTTVSTPTSSVTIPIKQFWNFISFPQMSSTEVANVVSNLTDTTKTTTLWAFDNADNKWYFYAPSQTVDVGTAYATSKGYKYLDTQTLTNNISKFSFWVNSKTSYTINATVNSNGSTQNNLLNTGWNMISVGNTSAMSPANFVSQSGKNIITIWEWDANNTKWGFYAPVKATDGTLSTYATSKGYYVIDSIKPGMGYWINVGGNVDTAPATAGSNVVSQITPLQSLSLLSDVVIPVKQYVVGGKAFDITAPATCKTLVPISKGSWDSNSNGSVTALQNFLAKKYNLNTSDIVSGYYGDQTKALVTRFQTENNLEAVGYVGPATRDVIKNSCTQ